MNIIESHSQIIEAINAFPDTRSTSKAEESIERKGIGYPDYIIDIPIEIETEKYNVLTRQVGAYLKICEQICERYNRDPSLKRYIRAMLLQFENKGIRSLVENYPLATMTGTRFGTDSIELDDGNFKTTEVNIGPVGGPPEAIKAQSFFEDRNFPISPDTFLDHLIFSINAYYQQACTAMGIEPKSFDERHIVYVENDGWFTGSFHLVDSLKRAGMNIDIAPREALVYNEKNNTLNLSVGDIKKPVDQLILYFHLQDDLSRNSKSGSTKESGDIIEALQNNAVLAETSMFSLIIAASKSVACLVSNIANDPEGLLARRLHLDTKDLELLKDMFPRTYQWRKSFFDQLESNDFTKFELMKFFISKNYIVKKTISNLYGGEGVYGVDKKGYDELLIDIREQVLSEIASSGSRQTYMIRRLINNEFTSEFKKYIQKSETTKEQNILSQEDKTTGLNLDTVLAMLHKGINADELVGLNFNEEDINRARNVYKSIHGSFLQSRTAVQKFLEDYALLLAKSSNVDICSENIDLLVNGFVSYLSSKMVLPYVIQEKIASSTHTELRTCGFIGDQATNNVTAVSTLKPSADPRDPKVLHLVIPDTMPIRHVNRTEDPLSKILETEIEAPIESTALEMDILSPEQNFDKVLVMMCGAGRHARYLAKKSKEVKGVDISPEFINEAREKSSVFTNIQYETADGREYFNKEGIQNTFDLVVILGNGLSYLSPEEQLQMLKDVHSSLIVNGIVVFDFVDLEKFSQILDMNGPVGAKSINMDTRAYQRITRRSIKEASNIPEFYAIEDKTSYIVDSAYETTNEKTPFYVPTPEGIYEFMPRIGYKNIDIRELFDNRYSGMLRYRWIVKAEK